MLALVVLMLVGSGGMFAHALSDLENGCATHSRRVDVGVLWLCAAIFTAALLLPR
jgi:hypothetical protein